MVAAPKKKYTRSIAPRAYKKRKTNKTRNQTAGGVTHHGELASTVPINHFVASASASNKVRKSKSYLALSSSLRWTSFKAFGA